MYIKLPEEIDARPLDGIVCWPVKCLLVGHNIVLGSNALSKQMKLF